MNSLKIQNLCYDINDRIIFKDVNIEISNYGLYLVSGRNGIGKTTLFNIISGNLSALGRIYINDSLMIDNGRILNSINEYISYVRFEEHIFDSLNMKETFSMLGLKIDEYQKEINTFALNNLKNNKVKYFSKGERQRLYLLMHILTSKSILLLDEVTTNLNPKLENDIFLYLKDLAKRKIIIYISNSKRAMQYADYDINLSSEFEYKNVGDIQIIKKEKIKYKHKRIYNEISSICILPICFVFLILSAFFFYESKLNSFDNYYKTMIYNENDKFLNIISPDNYYNKKELEKLTWDNKNYNYDYLYKGISIHKFLNLDYNAIIMDEYNGAKIENNKIYVPFTHKEYIAKNLIYSGGFDDYTNFEFVYLNNFIDERLICIINEQTFYNLCFYHYSKQIGNSLLMDIRINNGFNLTLAKANIYLIEGDKKAIYFPLSTKEEVLSISYEGKNETDYKSFNLDDINYYFTTDDEILITKNLFEKLIKEHINIASGYLPFYLLVDSNKIEEIASFLKENELILDTLSIDALAFAKLYNYIDISYKSNVIKGYLFIGLIFIIYIINKFIYYLLNKEKYTILNEFNFERRKKIICDLRSKLVSAFVFCTISILFYITFERIYLFNHTMKFGIRLLNITQVKLVLLLVFILYFYMSIINLIYELVVHRKNRTC